MSKDSKQSADRSSAGKPDIPHRKNDELLKGIFKENFPDFLRFMYAEADQLFDFPKGITFLDKELLKIIPDRDRKSNTRIADLLVKVYLLDGAERWLLVHTEIEGGSDPNFSFRIFQYNYRILDRYQVPVETIAIFTGDDKQVRPGKYVYDGIKTSHHFNYLSYHILDHEEGELLAMDNIFAYIVLACRKALLEGKVPEEELAADRSTIARTLIDTQKYDKDRIISFLIFLKSFIFIRNNEINSIFDTYIYEVTGGTIDMGVLEIVKRQEREYGLEKGRIEERARAEQELARAAAERIAEKRSFIRNLINQTDFSDQQIASIAETTVAMVEDVRAEVAKK
ncbi:hypothetical protein ORI89_10175 [Sphingobacterium sp. UT-1RO-CII-1]|uniref:hypothetical protein n=1 Tax=Sphingobacterium sp. UT-1RO-CII-1 TaxID=2995225 RepID=UPI00227B31B2|nr:hypothetical protein [Sphingobacterium sp. UT-1RO-CII-1]MCY4780017.1 hypothetical protein [Sphingobacterium sp. UT-1RO-CII-1]